MVGPASVLLDNRCWITPLRPKLNSAHTQNTHNTPYLLIPKHYHYDKSQEVVLVEVSIRQTTAAPARTLILGDEDTVWVFVSNGEKIS